MADIFLSYSRTDKPLAEPLVAALEAKGWSVWWDMDLAPGSDFDSVTAEALESARAVVVLWTPTSVASRWVRGEARVGADRGVLIPVRFETAELPIDVRAIHTTDLDGWEGDPASAAFRKLEQSLAALLKAPGSAAAASPIQDAPLPLPTKPSIAVLPFANLSGDPEQDYFADGMVEEITQALSRCRVIFVIGGGSGLSFKGKGTTAQEAARILGVRYILEGSVRKAGARVRIAVKLVDGIDGSQVWTERFEDTLEDVFALQDRVALSVAGVIEPTVMAVDLRRASGRPTERLGSYDLLLRATARFRTFAKPDLLAALDLLDRAIALDPDFGLAPSLAAVCHGFLASYGSPSDLDFRVAEVRRLTQLALKVGGDDAVVLANAALALSFTGGDPKVIAALAERALALNPGSSAAWFISGWVRLSSGEPDVGFEHIETALRLDPLSQYLPTMLGSKGVARFAQGRFAEAAALLSQSIQLSPEWPLAYAILAACQGHLGAMSEAQAAIAGFAERSLVDIRSWATVFLDGALKGPILEGVDLAEGRGPA